LRTQFFLADVVRPAAAALTDTTAHHQHVDQAAVVHVHVVPVVQTGTDNHHGATVGFVRGARELTSHTNHIIRFYTSDLFLPGGRVRHVVGKSFGAVDIIKTVIDTVVGEHQVVHGGNQRLAAVSQLNAAGGHFVQLNTAVVGVLKVVIFVGVAAEIGESHFGDFIGIAFERELQIHLFTSSASAGFEVPFALFAPAITDSAARADQTLVVVDGDGFPVGVIGFAEIVHQIRRAQKAS